uniref:Disintegrin and metalloproteinase domain-containing protein 12 n=1 Tax=Timema bartmani TaxID=61472 RepID=A0A7R9F004_9NEOP|nr:unnamed protein product [Timema bartmani]
MLAIRPYPTSALLAYGGIHSLAPISMFRHQHQDCLTVCVVQTCSCVQVSQLVLFRHARVYRSHSLCCSDMFVVALCPRVYQPPILEEVRSLLARRPQGESASEFSRHTLVKVRMYHGREKREISTTQEQLYTTGAYHSYRRELNNHRQQEEIVALEGGRITDDGEFHIDLNHSKYRSEASDSLGHPVGVVMATRCDDDDDDVVSSGGFKPNLNLISNIMATIVTIPLSGKNIHSTGEHRTRDICISSKECSEQVVEGGELVQRYICTPLPYARGHNSARVGKSYFDGSATLLISIKKTGGDGHIHDLTIGYNVHGRDYVLDLRLNRDLIPKSYFERYQHNGQHVVNRPTGKDVELCQYQGRLRGLADSWAAISTCHGISGVIFDGEELHYLERSSPARGREEENSSHFMYSHSDLKVNQTCGYSGTPHHILENQEFNRILRYKRDTEVIRGPYNANKQSRYVELVLVVDNKLYKDMGENLQKVYSHCKEIANIINSLYVPLNIFIALVGVVVWTEFDEITLSANGDTTLTNFLHYRRERLVKEHPNDNAQLLTRVQFDGGVVGKALKGPICTYEFSGGVSMDHSSVVGLVATTVAHEMGHNFGMEHDTSDCDCPSDRCIMAPSSSSMTPTQWSSCSLGYLALAFEHGMDYCLRNKPDRLFDSPVCGNGFVEAGEQCDCGLKEQCDNTCCNATSCMLYSNASCATGECCDLKAFCYQGSCRTHSDQCRLLWGPSGKSSDKQCYEMNTKGSRHGNCGYNRFNQSFIKCGNENIQCGMLHCKHLNERLEFGMESVAILSHSFINAGGSIIPCRTAIVDLGLNQVDPGLAPDGAKCGDGKMCVNQKCMSVGSLRKGGVCPKACSGNGVCNSLGHCHCIVGFSPPNCDYPGTGGSEDSGPASDPNARRDVMTALYIIFLGIVPLVALIALFMYYTRHNVKHWWKKGGHPAAPSPAVANSSRNLPSYVHSRFFSRSRTHDGSGGGGLLYRMRMVWFNAFPSFSGSSQSSPNKTIKSVPTVSKLEISKQGLVSTTNADVINIPNVEFCESIPPYKPEHPASSHDTIDSVEVASGSSVGVRVEVHSKLPSSISRGVFLQPGNLTKKTRKLSKGLNLKMPAPRDIMKHKLLQMSDSSNPSTPDTPPSSLLENNPMFTSSDRPSVAQLSSHFLARAENAPVRTPPPLPPPSTKPPPPPSQDKRTHILKVYP